MSSLLEFVVEVCVLCDMDSDCGGYPHSMDFVDTQKACINVEHIDETFLRQWWTQIGTPFAKQFMKELKEMSGKSCIFITGMCVRQQGPENQVRVKEQKPFGR